MPPRCTRKPGGSRVRVTKGNSGIPAHMELKGKQFYVAVQNLLLQLAL